MRALIKAAYHLNNKTGNFILLCIFRSKYKKRTTRIFIAGLGNHGFTLISYAVCLVGRYSICGVIDPSERAKFLAEKILKCQYFSSLDDAVDSKSFYGEILYICSDHSSHLKYALAAKERFASVYIEKPLITSNRQVSDLLALGSSGINVFTGFNRPNAPYTKRLIESLNDRFNITFVVNGHFLPSDHWYRDSGQGSRILGNLTHWLDLSYRLLASYDVVSHIDIFLTKGSFDDISIVLRQSHRTINICFSANSEPIDGVEEFVFWNSVNSTGFINNFRSFASFNGYQKIFVNNIRKDVGHIQTILAPLKGVDFIDPFFIKSSLFCLSIENMLSNKISYSSFSSLNFKYINELTNCETDIAIP
uniref:Gfo/Idh/MocA family protein n=1 Tax=Limnohabitans sp. TaxID=1907725 RepID=UPI004047D3A3